ncbi:UDP-N-acetylmuramoyl-L-alanyl-D-glutamate--2,6-diaminopimelate ligase [Sediminivirga luteola]|uniref:UDP-N-acetylmuramoyl-L-alanyl-D-glutamate--2,6-diaminopimelate ligase n=1 Tax=Sediminivirga luteola TaxID=1774748 RepID=A0A8J2TZP6_9MICO|nr:UDP-N-acetylmuramoyl-L-alanyl-D-glutamate--2,6-diaminopimelate ligase [Sediminivirga luteola]MCI2267064.1 UDP-N-acetylmuramoyl-L-alanyl-D-glutamate--2,6-diaminopimelate ligase [Sediminivirga luteola]GGA21118.1 UDP-N-acetylmuramoyl-L-alanyl-D-glutamate--2,6-diaminopimelate ligase [Sediminivirga luteola]
MRPTLEEIRANLGGTAAGTGDWDARPASVAQDSRLAGEGSLYAALPGSRFHGIDFLEQVLGSGALAVLTDAEGLRRAEERGLARVPVIVVDSPRAVVGGIARDVYGTDPDRPRLAGITGTNGKTSTAYLLDGLLRALGETTGLIGTVATRIGDEEAGSVRTTPEAAELHALMRRMREAGVTSCSMEVSSHALAQHRVDGLRYRAVAFTNLSQDHLDFHPDMEDYFQAKAMLFAPERADRGVVVIDDAWGQRLAREARIPVVTLSAEAEAPDAGTRADYRVEADPGDPQGFTLHGAQGSWAARSPLPGAFNLVNTATAMLLARDLGFGWDRIVAAAARLDVVVPGRMEKVWDQPLALVDYSHTPDAIGKALGSLGEAGRPLVIVLGAGGERDPGKRPGMGEAATRGADVVIVTDDNPRSEDPAAIRASVLGGARGVPEAQRRAQRIEEIVPREAAIDAALQAAGRHGTVLVAGKGHEHGQDLGDRVVPFDDRTETRRAAARRYPPRR